MRQAEQSQRVARLRGVPHDQVIGVVPDAVVTSAPVLHMREDLVQHEFFLDARRQRDIIHDLVVGHIHQRRRGLVHLRPLVFFPMINVLRPARA